MFWRGGVSAGRVGVGSVVAPFPLMKLIRDLVVLCSGIVSAIYLLNIGFGIIEVIPDNTPIFGNLDEAAATALLINCLAYFGVDLGHFLKRKGTAEEKAKTPKTHDVEVEVERK